MPSTPFAPPSAPVPAPSRPDARQLPAAEPARTLRAAVLGLRGWTARQVVAALLFSVAFAVLIGYPTVLIPNSVFARDIPVVAWNYPVWILTSVLAGMLAATYVRPGGRAAGRSVPDGAGGPAQAPADDDRIDTPSRLRGQVLCSIAPAVPRA